MANQRLGVDLLRRAALVDELDDVQAGGVLERPRDIAHLEAKHGFAEQARQPAGFAPAQVAAVQRRGGR